MTKSTGVGRGGHRAGAGRKPGAHAPPTAVRTTATVRDVEALAKSHTVLAIETLATIAQSGESEAARVAAANSLLERAHGKIARPSDGKKAGRQAKAEEAAGKFAPRPPRLVVNNGNADG